MRLLRSHGERPRYRHRMVGTTARLDALQAAILRVKLRHLDGWNAHRRRAAAELRRALQGTGVETPAGPVDGGDHVYHLFVVRDRRPRPAAGAPRRRSGIASAVHYPVPVHRTEAYAQLGYGPGSLPVAEEMAEQVCSLPIFPGIDDDQISAIAAAVADLTNRIDTRRLRGDLVAMRSDIVDFAALARGPQIIGKHRQDAEPLGVAVVGYGYWGPNLVRNVVERPELELRALCEHELGARERVHARSTPASPVQADLDDVLARPGGRRGHRGHAAARPTTRSSSAALEAGKHVLVEKPLATTGRRRDRPGGAGRATAAWCSCPATRSSTARRSTRSAT